MDLLEKASIILTPTAYNNGEALCVKPSDGSGDFDFSRNSAATRVNAQGLVENVQILSGNLVQNGDFSEIGAEEVSNGSFSQQGSELITNGDFSDGSTGWNNTFGSEWVIGDGKATLPVGADGSYLAVVGNILTTGKLYKAVITTSGGLDANNRIDIYANSAIGQRIETDGTHTLYFTANGTVFRFNGIANDNPISIDNVSVVEVGQDWSFTSGATLTDIGAKITHTPTAGSIAQPNMLTIGKQYKLTYEITESISGSLKLNPAVNPAMVTSVGTHTKYFEADGTTLSIARTNASNNDVTITNISVKEVGQNWTFGTGFSIGENVAIYDDSANGNLLQSKTFTSGKKYNISFEIKSGSGSIAFLSSNGVTTYVGYATYGIGTHSVFFDYTTGSGFGIFASSFLGGAFSITNIKIIEITDDTNLPRINYENFSYQDVLGNELVVNGDFATDSNWSKDANWSIANGVATSTGVGRMFQSIPFLEGNIGTKVKVSFDITERISGGVKISCYGAASQILYTDVGTHTFIGTTTNSLNLYINNAGQGNLVGSIDNVSVKEYLGQEVVPDSGCGHWLFEPQSTNLITYSETYGSGTFFTGTSGSTIDNTTSISPSGEANATQVTSTGAGKIQSIAITTLSQNTDYAFSFYAKNVDATEVKSRVLAIGGSGGSGLTTVSYINEISTENWSRITHNFNTGTHTTFYLFMSNELNSGGTIQLWGAQLEQQSYATSYIPTEGTQTTRNSDVCTNGGSLASINSTEGVLYAEIAALENGGSVRIISLSDGTSDNIVQFRLDTNPNTLTSFLRGNGGSFAIKGITSVTQTDNNKIALVWNATNLIVWLNGVIAGTIATNDLPIGLNTLNFSNSVGSSNFFGKTKAVAVWKQALSDEELTELTTI